LRNWKVAACSTLFLFMMAQGSYATPLQWQQEMPDALAALAADHVSAVIGDVERNQAPEGQKAPWG
jgi:hypothetical protein